MDWTTVPLSSVTTFLPLAVQSMPFGEVTDRIGRVGQSVDAADDGRDGAGLDEPGQGLQVFGAPK
jgi:hypothetical protein